jgi:hypothetical protein
MKLYPDGAMAMSGSFLDETIRAVFKGDLHPDHRARYGTPTAVLETGTFDGRGSTTFLAMATFMRGIPVFTIEADPTHWAAARSNLAIYSHVECLLGHSVPVARGLEFLRTDPVLQNPDAYPHIYTDDLAHPVETYQLELQGMLFSMIPKPKEHRGDDLLRKYLLGIRDAHPFVLLDSAGGLGLLEFEITLEVMGDRPFWLLLDDVRHVKHFRSLERICQDESFEVLNVSQGAHAWALAHRT